MAMKKHRNAEDRMTPFLSNIVPGEVVVETPNTVLRPGDEIFTTDNETSMQVGNRAGRGKTLTVK